MSSHPFAASLPALNSLVSLIENSNSPGSQELQNLIDTVPRIVVWGSQSSGKTSFINEILQTQNRVSANVGTRCPIEFCIRRKKSDLDVDTFAFHLPSQNPISFTSSEAAENYVINNFNSSFTFGILRYTLYSEQREICVIDLPGVNADINLSYFEQIKDVYLKSPQSIILHIQNGMMDPANDFSTNFLRDIPPQKIVTVKTHIDGWIYDNSKFAYFNPECQILFSNKGEHTEQQVFSVFPTHFSKVFKSRDKIYAHIWELLNQKLQELSPAITKSLHEIQKYLETQFILISRTAPNMHDVARHFQNHMKLVLHNLLSDSGTDFCDLVQKMKKELRTENLLCSVALPSTKEIETELQRSVLWEIEGTQGTFSVIKKFISQLLGKLLDFVFQILRNFFIPLRQEFQKQILLPLYACTRYRQELLSQKAEIIFEQTACQFTEQLRIEFESLKENFYIEPVSTFEHSFENFSSTASSIVDLLRQQPELLRRPNDENLMRILFQHLEKNGSLSLSQAQMVLGNLKKYWHVYLTSFSSNLKSKIFSFLKSLKPLLETEINLTRAEDFSEDESTEKFRSHLLNIEQLLRKLTGV